MTRRVAGGGTRSVARSGPVSLVGARHLQRLVTALLLGWLCPGGVLAGGGWPDSSPEGFSASREGLPRAAVMAWNATVLIRGQAVLDGPRGGLRHHTTAGSGLVVHVSERDHTALVVTNYHVITCVDRPCDLRVGLAPEGRSHAGRWTGRVRVEASDRDRDLAFLKVELPLGVTVDVPRFATASCLADGHQRVLTIGWPDLTTRRDWGVDPPANALQHVKRYSHGSFLVDVASYRPHTSSGRILHRMGVIFHNADVLPGSSGGPLLTTDGLVVGINSQVVGDEPLGGHRYCARRSRLDVEGCAHLAITADEIADAMKRLLALSVDVAGCSMEALSGEPTVHAQLGRTAVDAVTP